MTLCLLGASKLYSGLVPNVLRGMSMNAGMLACYDQAKQMIATTVTGSFISSFTYSFSDHITKI